MKNIPKADLHMHIGGSYPLGYIRTITSKQEFLSLEESLNQIKQKGTDYDSVFKVFSLLKKIINAEERVHNGTRAILDLLKQDNVVYAELRTFLKDFGNGLESHLVSILSAMENSDSKLLLSLAKTSSEKYALETIRLASKYPQVVGIDVCENEKEGKLEDILTYLLIAKETGLKLTVHLGEVKDKDPYKIIKKIKPDRISHAVFLSEQTRDYILETKTPIEICLSSNLGTGLVRNIAEHAMNAYKSNPLIICTDDPLIFSTSLSQEYEKLEGSYILENLVANSFKYSFKGVK